MERNLYIFETVVENHFTHFFKAEDMTLEKWHNFLGHPSLSTLRYMKQLNGQFVTDAVRAIENCGICMWARQTRDSFPILNRRTKHLFELIRGDLWGLLAERVSVTLSMSYIGGRS